MTGLKLYKLEQYVLSIHKENVCAIYVIMVKTEDITNMKIENHELTNSLTFARVLGGKIEYAANTKDQNVIRPDKSDI